LDKHLLSNPKIVSAIANASPKLSSAITAHLVASKYKNNSPKHHNSGTRPLALNDVGSQLDHDTLIKLILVITVKINIIFQFFATFVCKGLRLWSMCRVPIRAMLCNNVVWWSRELVLDYECLNPCACDAYQETLVPISGCLHCDFPNRVPPSPVASWYELNYKKKEFSTIFVGFFSMLFVT